MFYKRERVNGRLLPLEQIDLRFQEPYKIYMSWRHPHAGRTITYVQGENKNKIRVNPGGLWRFLRLSLDPLSPMAMRGSHHSVLKVGLRNTIDLLTRQYQRGVKEDHIDLLYRGNDQVDGRPVYRLELVCRDKANTVCYAYRADIWIDQGHHLPTKLTIYNWDNQLYAYYEYRELKLNPGLKADAFRLSPAPSVSPSTAEAQESASP